MPAGRPYTAPQTHIAPQAGPGPAYQPQPQAYRPPPQPAYNPAPVQPHFNQIPQQYTTESPHRFQPPGKLSLSRTPDGFSYTFAKQ